MLKKVVVKENGTAKMPVLNMAKAGYKFVGWTDAQGNAVSFANVTANMNVYAKYNEVQTATTDNAIVGLNRESKTATFTIGANETVAKVKVGGTEKTFTANGTTVSFDATGMTAGETAVTIETTGTGFEKTYTTNVEVYDFAFGTKAEFMAWYGDYKNNYKLGSKICLTADIDFGGANLGNDVTNFWWTQADGNLRFNGIFDGKGHVLSNFTAKLFPIPGVAGTGVIKNVAMVGYKVTGSYGLIGVDMSGTMENCYFEGELTATNDTGAIASNGIGNAAVAHMKNVVVYAHGVSENHTEASIVAKKTSGYPASTHQNVIVATDLSNGYAYGTTNVEVEGVSGYASYVALRTAITELPEGFGEDWIMYNGVLVYKTTKSYYDALYNGTSMTVTNQAVLEEGIHIDEPTIVVTDKFFTTVTVTGLPATAYTVVGGTVTLNDTAVVGTNFTVTVTAMSKDGVKLYTQTVQTKVASKVVVANLAKQVVGLNRTALVVAVEGVENATDISVAIDGVKATATPTFADGEFTIAKSVFGATGEKNIKLQATVNGVTNVYNFTAEVVNFAIGNETEFRAWYIDAYRDNVTAKVVFTDDITLTQWCNNEPAAGSYSNIAFAGHVDGRGHVLKNFDSTKGFIPKLSGGTIENIALINMNTRCATWGEGMVGYNFESGTIRNCLFEGGTNGVGNALNGVSFYSWCAGKVENVVVLANRPDDTTANKVTRSSASFTNFYMVCNAGADQTLKGANIYNTMAEMKTAVTAVPTGFDTNLWTIAPDGRLTFKALVNEYVFDFEGMTDMGKAYIDKGSNCKIESTLVDGVMLDGKAVYTADLTSANKASQYYVCDATKTYAIAFKVSANATLVFNGVAVTGNVWNYLVIKEGRVFIGKQSGYMKEIPIGAYTTYPGATNNMLNFNISGETTLTVQCTNWFTK